jgi:hypothetical protein
MEGNRRIGFIILLIGVSLIVSIMTIPHASGAREGYIMNLLLRAMHDVIIDNPIDGQVLTYDGIYWINQNATSGADTTDCINLANQYQLVLNSTSGDCYIRALAGGSGITLQSNSTHIRINATSTDTSNPLIGQTATQVIQSITKTNIGTTYTSIYSASFDQEDLAQIVFNNVSDVRIFYMIDYVGTGQQQCRWVNADNMNSVLYESPTFTADRNPSVSIQGGDSDWFSRPAGFSGKITMLMQCKSTVGTDDPIIHGYKVVTR